MKTHDSPRQFDSGSLMDDVKDIVILCFSRFSMILNFSLGFTVIFVMSNAYSGKPDIKPVEFKKKRVSLSPYTPSSKKKCHKSEFFNQETVHGSIEHLDMGPY